MLHEFGAGVKRPAGCLPASSGAGEWFGEIDSDRFGLHVAHRGGRALASMSRGSARGRDRRTWARKGGHQ